MRTISLFLFGVIIGGSASPPTDLRAESVEKREIAPADVLRNALAWRASWGSLKLTYSLYTDPPPPAASQTGVHAVRTELRLIAEGNRWRADFDEFWDDVLVGAELTAFDGIAGYHVVQRPQQNNRGHDIVSVGANPKNMRTRSAEPLVGLYDSALREWLDGLLTQRVLVPDGAQSFAGVSMPKFAMKNARGDLVSILVDPRFEFMPRLVSAVSPDGYGWESRVFTFRKVDGRTWIPETGRFVVAAPSNEQSRTTLWRLESAARNEHLDGVNFHPARFVGSRFVDPVADRAELLDGVVRFRSDGRPDPVGAPDSALWSRFRGPAAEPAVVEHDARPPSLIGGEWYRRLLLAASVGLLSVAYSLYLRRI